MASLLSTTTRRVATATTTASAREVQRIGLGRRRRRHHLQSYQQFTSLCSLGAPESCSLKVDETIRRRNILSSFPPKQPQQLHSEFPRWKQQQMVWTRGRRWYTSSSVAHQTAFSSSAVELVQEEEEDHIIEEEDGEADDDDTDTHRTGSRPKAQSKQKSNRKKRKKPKQTVRPNNDEDEERLTVNLLHFRENSDTTIHNNNSTPPLQLPKMGNEIMIDDKTTTIILSRREQLEEDFDRLAAQHDLKHFNWIPALEKKLVLLLHKHQQDDAEVEEEVGSNKKKPKKPQSHTIIRHLWKVALQVSSNTKRVPEALKQHFIQTMVATTDPPTMDPPDTARTEDVALSEDDPKSEPQTTTRGIEILVAGRTMAVERPLLWRRDTKEQMQHKAEIAQEILLEQQQGTATTTPPVPVPVPSFETTYLQQMRVPVLRKVHYDEKSAKQRYNEAQEFQHLLVTTLPPAPYQKVMELVETYIACFTDDAVEDVVLGEDDDEEADEERLETETIEGETTLNTKQHPRTKQYRVLLSKIKVVVPKGRIHTIGQPLADFFYVTVPDDVTRRTAASQLGRYTPMQHHIDPVRNDPLMISSRQHYTTLRTTYIASLLNISKLFYQIQHPPPPPPPNTSTHHNNDNTANDDSNSTFVNDDEDNGDHDNEASSLEDTFLRTFEEVRQQTKTDIANLNPALTSMERMKPRKYIPMDAMDSHDYWSSVAVSAARAAATAASHTTKTADDAALEQAKNITTSEDVATFADDPTIITTTATEETSRSDAIIPFPLDGDELPPIDRLVMVDNLPIDMTQETLFQMYGRMGTIEAIQIFNQRPDLAPVRKAIDSKKKIRNASSTSYRSKKWERPRTPVYALILYQDATGAAKASCDPLRIFGMVVDHHLMRSFPASDMHALYLEDVVPSSLFGYDVRTIESGLNTLFEPIHLNVCLDDYHHNYSYLDRQKKKGLNQKPLSYKITFPNFHAAYTSYWKLKYELELLQEEEKDANHKAHELMPPIPSLHWMKTPPDAVLYWTRKLNY